MFGAPFSPKRAACGAQRRPRRCGWQICRFCFSCFPSSPCAADPSAASAAIVTDLRCRRGKFHDSSSKKCFDGFAGNFWYFGFFRRLLLFFVLRQGDGLSVIAFSRQFPRQRHALSVTFGDTSPIGRGTGVPVRPTRDEQSLFYPETVVPCGLDSQQFDKGYCPAAPAPVSEARPFAPYRTLDVQRKVARHASGSPFGGAGAERLRGYAAAREQSPLKTPHKTAHSP